MIKSRSQKILLAVAWSLVIILLLAFGLKLLRDFVLIPSRTSSSILPSEKRKPNEQEINIYFAEEDDTQLAPEVRRVRLGAGTTADATAIMNEMMKGPQSSGLLQTVPADTHLLNAYQVGGTLVLDFTHEIQSNHPGGTAGELLTVYSIVNTMTENLRDISDVQILVEGQEIETLAGHLDITRPLRPRKNWTTG